MTVRDTPIVLRAAQVLDAGAVGAILHHWNQGTSWMPNLYSEAQAIQFVGQMIERGWVSVACLDGQIVGFLAQEDHDVLALYVAAQKRRLGVGIALLSHAMRRSDVLELWTFQANHAARTFYRRAGFEEIAQSDGTRNDEGLPDVKLRWQREAEA